MVCCPHPPGSGQCEYCTPPEIAVPTLRLHDPASPAELVLNERQLGINAARMSNTGDACIVFQLGEYTFKVSTDRARKIAAGIVQCCDHLAVGAAEAIPVPRPENKDAIRLTIRVAMKGLEDELGKYEHTCHGAILMRDGVDQVAQDLVKCYKEPGAFTVSQLAQAIRRFVREG